MATFSDIVPSKRDWGILKHSKVGHALACSSRENRLATAIAKMQ
jgi:hypothetical protein